MPQRGPRAILLSSPLLPNTLQIIGRGLFMAAFIGPWGVSAVSAAFAISAAVETCFLGSILAWRLGVSPK